MNVRDILKRPAISIDCAATLAVAATTMRREAVGSLIVTDHNAPVGMVTDRDLVIRGMARGVALDARIDSVMTIGIIGVAADADIREAVAAFGTHAVRRLPVSDDTGVIGVVSVDELVTAFADELATVSRALAAQLAFPHAETEPNPPALVG